MPGPTKADLEEQLAEKERQNQELIAELLEVKKKAEVTPSSPEAAASTEPPAWLGALLTSQQQLTRDLLAEQQKSTQDIIKLQQKQMETMKADMDGIMKEVVDMKRDSSSSSSRSSGPKPVPPPKLAADISLSKFKSWRSTWQDYAKLSKMDGMEEGQQRSLLKSHLTQDMRGVLEHVIVIDESVDKTPDAILDKIEENIRKKRNVTVDLVKFDTRTQMQFESAETYLVAIRELAADANLTVDHCNDCKKKCLERRLTARLISGIHDEGTQKKLLTISPFPKLDQVIAKVNAEESAARDNNSLRGREVNRNFTQGQDRSRNSSPSTSSSHPHSPTCNRCGKGEHRSGQTCPAKNQTCNYCNKLGHWEVVCKVKIRDNETNKQRSPQQSKRVGRIIINHVAATDHKCPEVTVKITHSSLNVELGEMQAIPDTGAEVCVAGTHAFPKHILNSKYLLPPASSLFTFNGKKSPCIGILPVRLRNGFHDIGGRDLCLPSGKRQNAHLTGCQQATRLCSHQLS